MNYLWQAQKKKKKKIQNHAIVTFLPNLALNRARYNSTAPHPHPSLTWEGDWGAVAETGQNKPNQTCNAGIMKPFTHVQGPWSWGRYKGNLGVLRVWDSHHLHLP